MEIGWQETETAPSEIRESRFAGPISIWKFQARSEIEEEAIGNDYVSTERRDGVGTS
jgi:hypothetical protein